MKIRQNIFLMNFPWLAYDDDDDDDAPGSSSGIALLLDGKNRIVRIAFDHDLGEAVWENFVFYFGFIAVHRRRCRSAFVARFNGCVAVDFG